MEATRIETITVTLSPCESEITIDSRVVLPIAKPLATFNVPVEVSKVIGTSACPE